MALINYEQPGKAAQPSPSIWADCKGFRLVENGEGCFVHEEFLGGVADTVAANEYRMIGASFSMDADDDTVLSFKASEVGGYQDIETHSDADDAWAIFTEPFCRLIPNSGKKFWLEGRLEVGVADADQGFFFGLGEEACQSRDVVADDELNLITETLMGFRIFTGEEAIDLVVQKDDGDESVLASDVTNLAVLDSVLGSGSKAALADNTEVKLGVRFDGETTVEFFVNGVCIVAWPLDSDYYDEDKYLCFVATLKAGAAAQSAAFDWIRYSAEF